MSARPMRCPGCGEQDRLCVLRYVPPVEVTVEHQSRAGVYTVGGSSAAEVRYECLTCGVFVEHWTYPMDAAVLQRYGYVS